MKNGKKAGNIWQQFVANINQASNNIAPVADICCDKDGNDIFFFAPRSWQ